MSNLDLLLLNHEQLPRDYAPQTIELWMDGQSVLRIEGGQKTHEVKALPAGYEPEVIEMRWDEQPVYVIQGESVLLNRLRLLIDACGIPPYLPSLWTGDMN